MNEDAPVTGLAGAEGLTHRQLMEEIGLGGRFVTFLYAISVVVMTFRRSTNVRFYRAGETGPQATSDGLGLGMAIARGIVGSQGGKIWIEDGRDIFTTRVLFCIPIGDDETNSKESEMSRISEINAA